MLFLSLHYKCVPHKRTRKLSSLARRPKLGPKGLSSLLGNLPFYVGRASITIAELRVNEVVLL